MTPIEHFTKAEQLLVRAEEAVEGSDAERYYVAAAQVHATLATAPNHPANPAPIDMPTGDAS